MPSVSKQLENWLKPLRLEEKQQFTNRAVVGGLDRYMVKGCDQLLASRLADKTVETFLKQLRRDFSQYMTLSPDERKKLIKKSIDELQRWSKNLLENETPNLSPQRREDAKLSIGKPKMISKISLSDSVLPLVPSDKLRAFQLTKMKTAEDLLHYSPKWAVHQSSFTPIAQCVNREEPYFILAKIKFLRSFRNETLIGILVAS